MATAHLISGLPCSGKTTYSKALTSDINSVHFALDYWLITAFGVYSIESVGHEEHTRRVLACRELIWRSAATLLVRGVDVILDDGFFLRDNRKQHIRLANEVGAQSRIHYLTAPVDLLRVRLERRNACLPKYNFRIDPGMLNVFIGLFEIPAADEGAPLVIADGGDNSSLQIAPF
jgi:predicted kinase